MSEPKFDEVAVEEPQEEFGNDEAEGEVAEGSEEL